MRNTLELHPYDGQPYYLGAFLLGAYQEILGDLHNLFGDTNAVHVSLDEDGEVDLNAVIKGDTVREVLHYVQYSADKLISSMRKDVERAVRAGKITAGRRRGSCCTSMNRGWKDIPIWNEDQVCGDSSDQIGDLD